MTRDEAAKLIPILQAWSEGKVLQCRSTSSNSNADWFDSKDFYTHSLVEWRIKPEKKTGWINIYRDPLSYHATTLFKTKEEADENASVVRIACIQITYEPGEGL